MSTQTNQKSLAVKPNGQQEQPSQRREVARSSPHTSFLQRWGESPFGLMPQDVFHANPFSFLKRMAEEMDRVFQEVGSEREGRNGGGWSPAIEVSQRAGKYSVRAERAGLEPNDVKVEVENDSLVIQRERKFEHEGKDGGVQQTERLYGLSYRSIPLPEGANVEQAQAKFHNGILEVTIPVPDQQANRRSIPIEGEKTSSNPSQSQVAITIGPDLTAHDRSAMGPTISISHLRGSR
jgi:HSP20 family protein